MVDRDELAARITGPLTRQLSTATVLFHHAVADRLGMGPTDHKCLDLILQRGGVTGSELAAATGLTTGAVTGVVARLERAGRIRREPHPDDRRKQVLRADPAGLGDLTELFATLGGEVDHLLDGLDAHQLAGIVEYLTRAIAYSHGRAARLRAETAILPTDVRGAPDDR